MMHGQRNIKLQNVLLHFHCNNGQANTPPRYVIQQCLFCYYVFFVPTQSNIWVILTSHQETRRQRINILRRSDSSSGPDSRHRDWS